MPCVVRISILRCEPDRFAELRQMMAGADPVLRPGIQVMRGLIDYYAGEDEAASSLVNTSVWHTIEDARQMDTFQPMLDLAEEFADKGVAFERPILNYTTLWSIEGPTSLTSATVLHVHGEV